MTNVLLVDDNFKYLKDALPFYGYVVTVHDLEEDPDYQKWMVEFEEKVTKTYYEANTDAEDKCENLYARDESYKPFGWQK